MCSHFESESSFGQPLTITSNSIPLYLSWGIIAIGDSVMICDIKYYFATFSRTYRQRLFDELNLKSQYKKHFIILLLLL